MTLASPRRSTFHAIALLAIAGLAINFSTRGALALEPATPLGGPTVETKVAPGSNGTFGSGKASVKARGEREIPHRDFMRAVQEALAAGAPEGSLRRRIWSRSSAISPRSLRLPSGRTPRRTAS